MSSLCKGSKISTWLSPKKSLCLFRQMPLLPLEWMTFLDSTAKSPKSMTTSDHSSPKIRSSPSISSTEPAKTTSQLWSSTKDAILSAKPSLLLKLSMERSSVGTLLWPGTPAKSTGQQISQCHRLSFPLTWGRSLTWIWLSLQLPAIQTKDLSLVAVISALWTVLTSRSQMLSSQSVTTTSSMLETLSQVKLLRAMSREDLQQKNGKSTRSSSWNDHDTHKIFNIN